MKYKEQKKSKMKMCKYWMDMTEPHTIIFPTIWGKKNNIKILQPENLNDKEFINQISQIDSLVKNH